VPDGDCVAESGSRLQRRRPTFVAVGGATFSSWFALHQPRRGRATLSWRVMEPHSAILDVLRGIVDPEIGLNIVDLGLVYRVGRAPEAIEVAITMTTRACPLGEMIVAQARAALAQHFPDVARVSVSLVFEPPWTPAMITTRGREQLAM
jgi:metal-sulfur cluster biosynthetic enzyme